MSTHRKSGEEYLKEYNKHYSKAESIKIDMVKRLNQLIKIYPQAPVGNSVCCMIDVYHNINNLSAANLADFIIKIEQYAEKQSGHVQTRLFE